MKNDNGKRKNGILFILFGGLLALVFCIAAVLFVGNSSKSLFNSESSNIQNVPDIIEIIADSIPSVDDLSIDDSPIIAPLDGKEIDLETLYIPFWESYEHINNFFIDQPIDNQVLVQGAIDGLNLYLEETNIILAEIEIPDDAPSAKNISRLANTPSSASNDFLPYWELWQKLLYVEFEDNLAYDILLQYSLSNMALSLNDPYTSYMDPVQFQMNQEHLNPSGYEGIGAWVDISLEYVTIISPMIGSPAEAANLRPGDKIIAIDGEDMTGIDGSLVLNQVLGPAGSKVVLTISRQDHEPFDVEIQRATIKTPSIRGEILEEDIAYIRIYSFSVNSPEEVQLMLEKLLAEDPKGLILDLRYNPGGYVNQVIEITSEFLTEGVVLYEQYGDGSKDTYPVLPGGIAVDIPMVVIVNDGSASASEILAGALQDYDRAIIVGQTTFGKGSVLVNIPLSDEKGSISITIAKWLSPNGRYIQDLGIEPNVFVELTEEDFEAGLDPQLNKAIELLVTP